jgi:hypothetical protein
MPEIAAERQAVLDRVDGLTERNMFRATTPPRDTADDPTSARMLIEQTIEYNSKLGRCPTASDRQAFGPALCARCSTQWMRHYAGNVGFRRASAILTS